MKVKLFPGDLVVITDGPHEGQEGVVKWVFAGGGGAVGISTIDGGQFPGARWLRPDRLGLVLPVRQ